MNALTRPDTARPVPPPGTGPTPAPPAEADAALTLPGAAGSVFAFQARGRLRHGLGPATLLPRGPVATLATRLAGFFRVAGPDAVLAGALPFDRDADDCLWQVARVIDAAVPQEGAIPTPPRAGRWRLTPAPDADTYAAGVQGALDLMTERGATPERLKKIVLSRSLVATGEHDIDLAALFCRLAADPAATAFLVPLPERDGTPRVLAGATPELLLAKSGAHIASHPLAGSARRKAGLAEDAAAAATLAGSEKDRREHAIVVEFILDTLTSVCRRLSRPDGTTLTATASMWHLGTRIVGELKDKDLPAVVLAAMLHPTPAVCGVPREAAARHIRALEGYDRDFYAGAVGWCDGRGDGAWHVTIRCAEISGPTARLYAGAGIVPGSDPWAEVEETAAKFTALTTALGIPQTAERRP